MSIRFCWSVLLSLTLAVPVLWAADAKDAYGDALPTGAKARLGTERMRLLDSGSILMPDGKTILSQTYNGITLIDAITGLTTSKLAAQSQPSVVSANGKRGAATRYDGVTVMEFDTGKKLCEIKRSGYSTDGMASLSSDGKILALGGNVDEKAKEKGVSVRVWNVDDDKEITSIKVSQNTSAKALISADGKTLATWGSHYDPSKPNVEVDPETNPNQHVQLWNAATGKLLATVRASTYPSAVSLSLDGQSIAVGANGAVALYSTKTGEKTKQLLGRSQLGRMVQFSDDGQSIAAASDDGAIQMWTVATGKSLGIAECPLSGMYLSLRGLSFPTGDKLVAYAMKGSAGVVWECPSGKRLSPAGGHTESIGGLGFTNGDKEIIGSATGGQILRWDLAGKELATIPLRIPGSNPATQYFNTERLQIAPNGLIGFRPENSGLAIYDLPSGLQRYSLPSENTYVSQLCFSNDGGKVAMVQSPGYGGKPKPSRIALADLAKGEITGGFVLPAGNVISVGSDSEGAKLAVVRRVNAVGKIPQKLFLTGFDTATGKQTCEMTLAEDYGNFFLAASTKKGNVVLVDPKEGVVEIDLATGKKDRTVAKLTTGLALAPLLSGDGKLIALATGTSYSSEPSSIEIRDFASGEVVHTFTGHTRSVTAMAFSKDGKTLATGSADSTILLWDLTKSKD